MPGQFKKLTESKDIPLKLTEENIQFVTHAIECIERGNLKHKKNIDEIENDSPFTAWRSPEIRADNRRVIDSNRQSIELNNRRIETLKKILAFEKITAAEQQHLLLIPEMQGTFLADKTILLADEIEESAAAESRHCCTIF